MLKRITVGVSRLVGASWVRRPGRTFCPQLVPPSSHRKIRYYKRKKGHIHNQSSRISRNKSAHRLESTKHSVCCCWIILFAALSLSIVVYCRLCCSGWLNCVLQDIELCFGSVWDLCNRCLANRLPDRLWKIRLLSSFWITTVEIL